MIEPPSGLRAASEVVAASEGEGRPIREVRQLLGELGEARQQLHEFRDRVHLGVCSVGAAVMGCLAVVQAMLPVTGRDLSRVVGVPVAVAALMALFGLKARVSGRVAPSDRITLLTLVLFAFAGAVWLNGIFPLLVLPGVLTMVYMSQWLPVARRASVGFMLVSTLVAVRGEVDPSVFARLQAGSAVVVLLLDILMRRIEATVALFDSAAGTLKGVSSQLLVDNQALARATAEATQASQAKSEFLANVSHEIRTPMNAIVGMSYLASTTPMTPQQRVYLDTITRSSRHLLGVLNDVLDLAKIEAGKLTAETAPFALAGVIDGVCDMVLGKCTEKGLELVVDVGADVPDALEGDALRLRQILANLLGNAVKFTERGEVGLHVRVRETRGESVALRFEVRDTGIGISDAQRAMLFQNFQQGDASTTRRFGGTGLGLAISRNLAVLMGGDVGVESEPGVGSTFWVDLPFERAAVGALAERSGTLTSTPPGPIQGGGSLEAIRGARVLLVEDNEINQEVASGLLRHCGVSVEVAENGAVAVARLQAESFDLVLMDMQMPVMDGLAATRAIRALPGGATVPIVAMTANAMDSDRLRCLEAGMNDHLGKPVEPDALHRALVRWIVPARG
jgi:signal transduction histidine kinase/ActR/RegA family two-component response regulator